MVYCARRAERLETHGINELVLAEASPCETGGSCWGVRGAVFHFEAVGNVAEPCGLFGVGREAFGRVNTAS